MKEHRLILGALNFHASAVKERGHRQTHTYTHISEVLGLL